MSNAKFDDKNASSQQNQQDSNKIGKPSDSNDQSKRDASQQGQGRMDESNKKTGTNQSR